MDEQNKNANKKKRKKSRGKKRKSKQGVSYEGLEARNLLATMTGFDAGTGALTIDMNAENDVALISINAGDVTVNGNSDLDLSISGPQTATVGDVQSIVITGTSATGQQVTLHEDFSVGAGGALNTLDISDVIGISITGDYEFSGDVTVSAASATSAFDDGSGTGHLSVGGAFDVTYGSSIDLANASHDFTGVVSIDATQIALDSNTAIEFGVTRASSDFTLTAGGNTTQATNTDIVVNGDTDLDAGAFNITLDTITNDFQGSVSVVAGNVTLEDTTDFTFGTMTAANDVDVRARGNIDDGSAGVVTAGGESSIESLFGNVALDNGSHDFGSLLTTGSVGGNIDVSSSGNLNLAPADFDADLTLTAGGTIAIDSGGAITVQGDTSVTATGNINLSNAANDFVGSVAVDADTNAGQTVTLTDSNSITLGNVGVGDDLTLTSGGALTQSGGTTISVGGDAIVAANGNVTLDESTNDFNVYTNTTTTGNVSLADTDEITLQQSPFAGNLIVDAAGNINIAGPIDIVGTSNFSSDQAINLNQAGNSFGGEITLDAGSDATIHGDQAMVFGSVTAPGNFEVFTNAATGPASVTDGTTGAISVGGVTSIATAIGNDLIFDNATNDFGGSVNAIVGAAVVSITDSNDLILGTLVQSNLVANAAGNITQSAALNITGTTTITSNGNVTLNNAANSFAGAVNLTGTNSSAGTFTLENTSDFVLGIVSIASDLDITTSGTISESSTDSVIVGGNTTFDAVSVNLDNSSNNFGSVEGTTTGDLTLVDTNNIQIGDLAVGGNLSVDGANVTDVDSTSVTVTGTTQVSAAGDIVLNNANNDFVGTFTPSATGDISLLDSANNFQFNGSTISGDLDITALGNLSFLNAISVAGDTTVSSPNSVNLGNAANDFTGQVSVTSSSNISIADANSVSLGNVDAGGTLDVTATTGSIDHSEGMTIEATGDATLSAGTTIDVGTEANDFGGVIFTTATGDVEISDINDVTLGTGSFAGNLTVDAGGNLTRQSGGSIVVSGDSDFTVDGNITLNDFANDFVGPVSIDSSGVASSTSLIDQNDFQFGDVVVAGDLFVSNVGDITQDANSIDVDGTTTLESTGDITLTNSTNDFTGPVITVQGGSGAQDVSLTDANAIELGTASYSGNLTVNAGGDISRESAGSISVAGDSSFTTTADVNLGSASNDFTGKVDATAVNATIHDANDLVLGNVDLSGNLNTLSASGTITDDASSTVSVDGTATITASDDVTLDSNNDFNIVSPTINGASLSLTEVNDVAINSASALELAATDVGGDLQLTTADLTNSGAIVVEGQTTINSTGNVILGNAANDFKQEVTITNTGVATHTAINDVNDLVVGAANVTNTLAVTAGGNIEDVTTDSISVDGESDWTGAQVTLDNGLHDFDDAVFVSTTGAATISDANSLELGSISTGGNLTVSAGGDITVKTGESADVTGTSSFTAVGEITIDNVGNDFAGALSITGTGSGAIRVENSDNLVLGNIDAPSTLSVFAFGTVTQDGSSSVLVDGRADITADDGIDLSNANNNFVQTVFAMTTTGDVSLTDVDDLTLGTSNYPGGLTLDSGRDIQRESGGHLNVANESSITAGRNITLDNSFNTFSGDVSIQATDSAGVVTISSGSAIMFDDVDVAGSLMVDSTGTISESVGGSIVVTGDTTLESLDDIQVNNFSTDFVGDLNIISPTAGKSVSVFDNNDLSLGTVSVAGDLLVHAFGAIEDTSTIAVQGDTTFTNPEDLTIDETGHTFTGLVTTTQLGTGIRNVELNATGNLTLHAEDFSGDLTAAATGDFQFENGDAVSVAGDTAITTGGNLDLSNAANDFVGNVSVDADSNAGQNVTIADINDIAFGTVQVSGNTSVTAGGDVSKESGASFAVTGTTTIDAGGDVALDSELNDFVGLVTVNSTASPYDVSLADANDLLLAGTGQYSGDLSLNVGNSVGWDSVTAIEVAGDFSIQSGADVNLTDPANEFEGNVSASGANVSLTDATAMTLLNVNATGNLTVTTGDTLSSDTTGAVVVAGDTDITSGDRVFLNSANNDFVGDVSIDASSGTNQRIAIQDSNDLSLANINTTGKMTVTAAGAVTDTPTASLNVAKDAEFFADSITLGEQVGDSVNFDRLKLATTGHAEVHEDSSMVLNGVTAGSSTLSTTGFLLDSNTSQIDVTGDAMFTSTLALNLGNSANDSVNTGRVNLAGSGTMLFNENSDMEFFGDNTAGVLFVTADGAITDADSSTINIVSRTNFTADSVVIGDSSTDTFNSNSVSFNVTGDVALTEDSLTLLTGASNVGGDLNLTSAGTILDSFVATTIVGNNANFVSGGGLIIGDQAGDSFAAGTVSMDVAGNARFTEDGNTVFAGTVQANGAVLTSTGIMSNQSSLDMDVNTSALLSAVNLELGNQSGDDIQVGSLTFNSSGAVNFSADSNIVFSGNSTAGSLQVSTSSFITDTIDSNLSVTGNAAFNGQFVKIGDTATDLFNAGSITFQSSANVVISEDSDMNLAGINDARNINLTSTGNITDDADAETMIIGSAEFTGVDLIIGELADDCFDILSGASGLTTNGTGTVDVQLGC